MTSNGKIGMMTFHASHNNGSMLQALALQHVLEDRFHQQTELIDFPTVGSATCMLPFLSPRIGSRRLKALSGLRI